MALGLAALAFGLLSCESGSGGEKKAATTSGPPERYSVPQVAKLARFKAVEGGRAWRSVTGCRVTLILTTHAEIVRYRTSPNSLVVSNPADDIGVKFDPTPKGCREALTANLTLVR